MNNRSSRTNDKPAKRTMREAPVKGSQTGEARAKTKYYAASSAGKTLSASSDYGVYRIVDSTAGTGKVGPAPKSLSTTLAPILAQLKEQNAQIQKQQAEIEALKKRLAQVEASRKNESGVYRVPQSLSELRPRREPPAGMTVMQAIIGKLDVEETTEELLAQLKALD